jgi:hypothetical protein
MCKITNTVTMSIKCAPSKLLSKLVRRPNCCRSSCAVQIVVQARALSKSLSKLVRRPNRCPSSCAVQIVVQARALSKSLSKLMGLSFHVTDIALSTMHESHTFSVTLLRALARSFSMVNADKTDTLYTAPVVQVFKCSQTSADCM